MSLRAILSGSRVKKKSPVKKAAPKAKAPAGDTKNKSGSGRGSTVTLTVDSTFDDDDVFSTVDDAEFDDDDYKLDDSGLASLADDLTLRDVVQALRFSRGNMFDPIPGLFTSSTESTEYDDVSFKPAQPRSMTAQRKGYVGNSARIADILNTRRRLPALATTAHIASLLPNATATERETVALVRAGVVRKVVQPQWRRGVGNSNTNESPSKGDARYRKALMIGSESLGEVLVETAELQRLVESASGLGAATKAAFSGWLGGADVSDVGDASTGNTKKFTINSHPAPQLTAAMVDELVRAGFLVGHGASAGLVGSLSVRAGNERSGQSDTGDVYARPEDRITLLSLETVAKAASGSFDAVGGVGAVYTAGGGGARAAVPGRQAKFSSKGVTTVEDVMLAVPGHGTFVKLVSGALAYLVGILARTAHRETLETSLKERWDAGGNITKSATKRSSSLKRVPLSRTKKWKDFYGMSFEWVLAEALGAGLIELFDTGSVGRGVRLLG